MSQAVNKAIVIGRLGQDPELRHTQGGSAVVNLRVATTESYKNRDGESVETTEWHNIVAWGRLAEICNQYLRKGSLAYFEGPLQTRSWEDRDGNKRYTTEIKALNMTMLDSKDSAPGGSSGNGRNQPRKKSRGGPSSRQNYSDGFEDDNFVPDDEMPF